MRPVLTLLLVLLGGAIQVCSAGAEETSKGRSNRLIQEKSPYLLQHAYNPVDWYPWGEEAFRLAREENRPIFLSVGYSTCYWCHVMEREVFENPGIADLMNRYFVNIKVDREERPDVDRIYMSALQALTGSGGWPMSMFLTPELEPFFGRTYVPPETFRALIGRIHEVWVKNRDDIAEAGRQLTEFLREQARGGGRGFTLGGVDSQEGVRVDSSRLRRNLRRLRTREQVSPARGVQLSAPVSPEGG